LNPFNTVQVEDKIPVNKAIVPKQKAYSSISVWALLADALTLNTLPKMASDQGLKQPVSNTVPQPRRSPPRAKAIASIASSSSTPSYLNPTQSTTNKAVVAVKPTPALEPSLRHTYRARQRSVISNASISSPSVSDRDGELLMNGIGAMGMIVTPWMHKLAPNERHQQGFRSPSASITTSTTPES
jgi:hypothetical protein